MTVQVVVPMAGAGSRFAEAGYVDPKPFIDVEGQPMIAGVIEDLQRTFDVGSWVFLVRAEHVQRMADVVESMGLGDFSIIAVPELTGGAACTVLLAEDYVEPNLPLVVANSDQRFRCKPWPKHGWCDSAILTFTATESKWSYVIMDDRGECVEWVDEKPRFPPSERATVGVYYFAKAQWGFSAIRTMMQEPSQRVNGEWYLAPCYNAMPRFLDTKIFPVDEMHGLGTPADLQAYLNRPENKESP